MQDNSPIEEKQKKHMPFATALNFKSVTKPYYKDIKTELYI